jgi:hypothetical protein
MRFLIIPFLVFLLSFLVVRTSNRWSTVNNWRRIGLEVGVSVLAFLLTTVVIGAIIVFFN